MEGTTIAGIIFFGLIYLIPTLVAWDRKHHQTPAIAITNIALGWTGLGWIGALIWSATATRGGQSDGGRH